MSLTFDARQSIDRVGVQDITTKLVGTSELNSKSETVKTSKIYSLMSVLVSLKDIR